MKTLDNSKVWITGASGFLGLEVVRRFADAGSLTALSHTSTGPGLIQVDMTDRAAFRSLLKTHRPDWVVHLAACREPDVCEADPVAAHRMNVAPVEDICAELRPDARLVFISTDYVFDGTKPPYREDDQRNPISEYGRTKSAAEDVARSRANSLVVRIPLLIGNGGFIYQMIDALKSGKENMLDDVLVRFPTWTRDIANALRYLMDREITGTIHVSSSDGATRYEWTRRTAAALGLPTGHLKPSKEVVQRKAGRPLNSQLSTQKLRDLGYPSFTRFEDVVTSVRDVSGTRPAGP